MVCLTSFPSPVKLEFIGRNFHWEQEQGERSQVSAIDIVTGYGLDDEGSEFESQ
jgi:hypothetical protein